MKALQQKGYLATSTALGAIGAHDQWSDKPLPVMDWSHLELPPYLRCASERCKAGQACMGDAIQVPCLARPAAGVCDCGLTCAYDDDGTRSYHLDGTPLIDTDAIG